MYCGKCGAQIKEGGKFCPKCGEKVGKQSTAAMAVAPASKSENTSTQKAGGAQEELAPVMSVVSYVILFILSAIPIVGIILILIYALDSTGNKNRRNYCRAIIVMWILSILAVFLFGASITGFLYALM